jgi:KDO2-lipid IV(A) lauroyltransferase
MGAGKTSRFFAAVVLAPLLFFCHALKAIGLPALGVLGAALGSFLHFLHFRRKIVRSNLELAFGASLSAEALEQLTKTVYTNIGLTFLEIARNFSLTREDMVRDLQLDPLDRAVVEAAYARGQGIIFISAHIGNWELLATGMAARGLSLAAVVKKMNNAVSQALIERQRISSGLEVIYSGGTIEKMREALRRNVGIGFMLDQNTTGKKGIRCNFFGVPASCIRALSKLVKESGAAVIPVCGFRESDGRHRVHLLPEINYIHCEELPAGSEERALREEWVNSQRYQHALEELVRIHPEQWLWIHRRWKASREPLASGSEHRENQLQGAR